jgi:hypothetical protein
MIPLLIQVPLGSPVAPSGCCSAVVLLSQFLRLLATEELIIEVHGRFDEVQELVWSSDR